ncbi:hypothetical protein PSTG_14365 [Puccinia striiformis f. sp. tritici PST-78]|uniref:Uncharacterized protein n=1 Tax=Puccinia striiformis f. sp. tritici PST-78 TaxID=1165861 RepID=A0A0L0UZC5_9BASI|nr:hypothetical protein PSTG_14365 [Puccinia striiformis f. sp. tritici PST-78]
MYPQAIIPNRSYSPTSHGLTTWTHTEIIRHMLPSLKPFSLKAQLTASFEIKARFLTSTPQVKKPWSRSLSLATEPLQPPSTQRLFTISVAASLPAWTLPTNRILMSSTIKSSP